MQKGTGDESTKFGRGQARRTVSTGYHLCQRRQSSFSARRETDERKPLYHSTSHVTTRKDVIVSANIPAPEQASNSFARACRRHFSCESERSLSTVYHCRTGRDYKNQSDGTCLALSIYSFPTDLVTRTPHKSSRSSSKLTSIFSSNFGTVGTREDISSWRSGHSDIKASRTRDHQRCYQRVRGDCLAKRFRVCSSRLREGET